MKVDVEGKTYYDLDELTKLMMSAFSSRKSALEEVKGMLDIVEKNEKENENDSSSPSAPVEARRSRRGIFIAELIIAVLIFLTVGVLVYSVDSLNQSREKDRVEISAYFLVAREAQEKQLEAYSKRIAELEKKLQALKENREEAKKASSSPRRIHVLKNNLQ